MFIFMVWIWWLNGEVGVLMLKFFFVGLKILKGVLFCLWWVFFNWVFMLREVVFLFLSCWILMFVILRFVGFIIMFLSMLWDLIGILSKIFGWSYCWMLFFWMEVCWIILCWIFWWGMMEFWFECSFKLSFSWDGFCFCFCWLFVCWEFWVVVNLNVFIFFCCDFVLIECEVVDFELWIGFSWILCVLRWCMKGK